VNRKAGKKKEEAMYIIPQLHGEEGTLKSPCERIIEVATDTAGGRLTRVFREETGGMKQTLSGCTAHTAGVVAAKGEL